LEYAYSSASAVGLIPTCEPSESTSLTRGTRIASLIRVVSWGGRDWSNLRLGLTETSPSCAASSS
jgi:hypothetical protein